MSEMSPAKAHRLRHAAAALEQAKAAAAPDLRHANAYELMLAQLAEHRRRLKEVQSVERKAEVKRAFLPEYAPWIQGTLQADTGVQDDVLMTVMVWMIDVGDYAAALPVCAYALHHGLAMPDQYQRPTACLIAEEFADAAQKARAAAQAFDPALLSAVNVITADHDMPDEVRAKLHKAIGLGLADEADLDPAGPGRARLELAVKHLRRAMALHDKVGVKKDIERLERKVNGLPPDAAPAPVDPQNQAAGVPDPAS